MKTFSTKFLLVHSILLLFCFNSNAQDFSWAKRISNTSGMVKANSVVVNAQGNSYIIGTFEGTATLGTIHLNVSFGNNIFTAKYDTGGNCLWAKQAGANNTENYGNSISVDADGNCYINGGFTGTATFGAIQLSSFGCVSSKLYPR
jgi:hypothetical protein